MCVYACTYIKIEIYPSPTNSQHIFTSCYSIPADSAIKPKDYIP